MRCFNGTGAPPIDHPLRTGAGKVSIPCGDATTAPLHPPSERRPPSRGTAPEATMPSISAFLAELKRRRVVRVLIGYCAAALVVIEAANNVFPAINLPASAARLVVVLALLGLPVALGLAWAFDVTPDGVTRTSDEPQPPVAGRPQARGRVPALAVYAGAVVIVAAGGTAAWARFGRGGAARAELSVAVLPF